MFIRVAEFAKAKGLQDSLENEASLASLFRSLKELEVTENGELSSPALLLDEIIEKANKLVIAFGAIARDVSAALIYADENEASDSDMSRVWIIFSISETMRDVGLLIRLCEKLKHGEKWPTNADELPTVSLLNFFIGLPFIKLAQNASVNLKMLEKLESSAKVMVDDAEMYLGDFSETFNEAYETGEIEGNTEGSLLLMRIWSGMIEEMPSFSVAASNLIYHHSKHAA